VTACHVLVVVLVLVEVALVVVDVLVLVVEVVLVEVVLVLVVVLILVEVVLVVVDVLVLVVEVVDTLVVVIDGGVGQPASVVGAVALLAILKTLFGVALVGALVTAPPAGPPKATQYVSPPVMVKRMPPSVPGAGGTTVMCGWGSGPSAPLIVTLTWNFPFAARMSAAFTDPLVPNKSL